MQYYRHLANPLPLSCPQFVDDPLEEALFMHRLIYLWGSSQGLTLLLPAAHIHCIDVAAGFLKKKPKQHYINLTTIPLLCSDIDATVAQCGKGDRQMRQTGRRPSHPLYGADTNRLTGHPRDNLSLAEKQQKPRHVTVRQ